MWAHSKKKRKKKIGGFPGGLVVKVCLPMQGMGFDHLVLEGPRAPEQLVLSHTITEPAAL